MDKPGIVSACYGLYGFTGLANNTGIRIIAGIQTLDDEISRKRTFYREEFGKSMDKVSNLAFLLDNESTNGAVKQAAVKLLTGDLTVKEIKNNNETKVPFNNASKKLRKGYIKKEELNRFIEQHMFSSK